MKYAIFFFNMFLIMCYFIFISNSNSKYILIWFAINFLIFSIAYYLNKPSMILGKNINGDCKKLLMIINFPWLLFTQIIFRIQLFFIKEDFSNRINNTNIWISRRPLKDDNLDKFNLIIDLTAEFTKDLNAKNYICFPNLDAHWLRNTGKIDKKLKKSNILVHCANGHGRSSIFIALLMVKWNYAINTKQALKIIKASRKFAIPNSSQNKWLKDIK